MQQVNVIISMFVGGILATGGPQLKCQQNCISPGLKFLYLSSQWKVGYWRGQSIEDFLPFVLRIQYIPSPDAIRQFLSSIAHEQQIAFEPRLTNQIIRT